MPQAIPFIVSIIVTQTINEEKKIPMVFAKKALPRSILNI